MLTHDPTWDALPATGYRPAYRVTAYSAGNHLGAPIDIPVTDGWVLKDATQYPRTHAQVTTAATSQLPTTINSNLTPFGGWLKVETGYTDAAGVTTYITLMDGPITRLSVDRPGSLLTIEAADASVLQSQRVTATDYAWDSVTYPGAYNMAHGIAQNIPEAYNISGTNSVDITALTADMLAIPVPTGYVWKAGATAWSVVEYLTDLIGAEAYCNENRRLILRPVPTVGAPVARLATGEGGTITELQSVIERTYNAVYLAYASGIVGTWKQPSFSGGPTDPIYYGLYCLYESRAGTPTQAQADTAARTYAYRVKGTGRTTSIRAVPMPWLEPGDTVEVLPDNAPSEYHLVQSVTIPLGLDVMTVTTRNAPYTGTL